MNMKKTNSKTRLALLMMLLSNLCLLTSAYAQITPLGDAYTNTADPTTNYGAQKLLDVESSQTTWIQFDLSTIPAGYNGASITKATLKLYVNAVTKAGSFNVDFVNGAWSEATITANNAPALGTTIAASVPVTTADKNQYILVDVTAALQAWLNGVANDGIALVGNSPLNASFDSKENTTTSHPAELDIVFAGIAGITTASGSGLTGGGTSGTLNLSLTNACSANQILQWNGSSWVCSSAGTGTITGVTHGTYLTGGGTSGNVTLDLNTTLVPLLAAANTFTGNQTVNGNLSATGVVTGSGYQIGSNLFAFGSYGNGNAFLGFAGNPNTTATYDTAIGIGALSADSVGSNTAIGTSALGTNTTGYFNTAIGENALYANTTGYYNTAIGTSALGTNTTGNLNTAVGTALLNNTTGSWNTAIGQQALLEGNGSNNTAVGWISGNTTNLSPNDGANDTFIGAFTTPGTLTNLNNATAIGSNAEVQASNAMVLGSINGVNGATASVNVGIGTTAPGATLEVDGSNQLDVFIKAPESGVGAGLDFFTTGAGGLQWEILDTGSGASQGAKKLNFRNVTAGADVLTLNGSGGVGIGTTNPDNTLTVNGSADKPGGGSWGTFSDGRLKNLNGNFNSGLSQVLKIHPVRYRYKPDNPLGIRDTDEHIGVVAQEVQQVIPEAVTENSKGYLLVNNDPIIWTMLNAIKEQQKEIRDLKSELRATRQSLQKVKAQVAASHIAVVAAK